MKFKIFMPIIITILVLAGCGDGTGLKEDSKTGQTMSAASSDGNTEIEEKGTDASTDEPEDASTELLYRTTVSYDPDTKIERTTLDTQGYNARIYFEIPVFEETSESYKAVNAYMRGLRDDFFTPENDNLTSAWESVISTIHAENEEYCYFRNAVIKSDTDEYVSISILYEWWVGGVADYGSDSYTFSKETGELLSLTDIVDLPEDEIKNLIMERLKERDAGENVLELDRISKYDLDDFEFNIADEAVWIMFDKYEAAYGAYGGFDIKLFDIQDV